MSLTRAHRAFTLIEMIVVVVVLAILATIGVVAYARVTNQAHLAAAQTTLRQIATATLAGEALSGGGEFTRAEVQAALDGQAGPVTDGTGAASALTLLPPDQAPEDTLTVALAFDRGDLLVDPDAGTRLILMNRAGPGGEQLAMLVDRERICPVDPGTETTAGALLAKTLTCTSTDEGTDPGQITDTQPPTAPGNAQVSVLASDVTLTWQASTDDTGVVGYQVHRSDSPDFEPAPDNHVGSSLEPTYTDAGLEEGTWYYRVVALDAAGNVSDPAAATATVDVTVGELPAPAPAGTLTGADSTLTWPAVAGATSYLVRSKTDDGQWQQVTTTAVTAAGTVDVGHTLTWQVAAVNRKTTSEWSQPVVHARPVNAPAQPTLEVYPLSQGTALMGSVAWEPVPGATGYLSSYRLNGGAWVETQTTFTSASVDMDQGQRIEVRVAALAATGQSNWSPVASYGEAPAMPAVTVTFDTTGTATATWPAVPYATEYQVRSRIAAGAWSTTTTTTTTTASRSSVPSGQTATFEVTAVSPGGTRTGVVTSPLYLAAPTVTLTRIWGNQATVSWTAVPGASSYAVTATGAAGTTTSATTATLTLSPSYDYTVNVKALNGSAASAAGTTNVAMPRSVLQSGSSLVRANSSNAATMNSTRGTSLVSPNGRYVAILGSDGRFYVIDRSASYTIAWTAAGGTNLSMQGDGNLVLYGSPGPKNTNTNIGGVISSAFVQMQDDGNLVVAINWVPKWALSWRTSNSGQGATFMEKWS